MDRIRTDITGGMPFDAPELEFLQNSYEKAIVSLTRSIFGEGRVVEGCKTVGNYVEPGWVFMGGELLYHAGTNIGSPVSDPYWTRVETISDPIQTELGGQELNWILRRAVPYADATSGGVKLTRVDLPAEVAKLDEHVTNHTWDKVTEKPTSFPPSAHNQDWGTIDDKPTSFPPSAHNQDWSTIDGKPTSFTPATHSHDWGTIDGKPTEFPPSAHSQDWSTIDGKPMDYTPSFHEHSAAYITGLTGQVIYKGYLDIEFNGTDWCFYGIGLQRGFLLGYIEVGFNDSYSSITWVTQTDRDNPDRVTIIFHKAFGTTDTCKFHYILITTGDV